MHPKFTFSLGLFAAIFAVSCGGGSTSPPPVIGVTVSPATAGVPVGQQLQLTATVTDTANTTVTWLVAGGAANGTVSSTGLYTAPGTVPNPSLVTVTATSTADTSKSGSAAITVTPKVSVLPIAPTVPNFGTQPFTATVIGTTNTAVNWLVNGVQGGSLQYGYISSSGLYYAPSGVPTTSNGSGGSITTTLKVTAVSQANTSASGSATVTLVPANQSAQALPVKLGSSGGNANDFSISGGTETCCGGTLGSLVTRGGTQYILSNNHVMARSDLAATGEPIIQPGLIDSNCSRTGTNTVANLTEYYNLETGTGTLIDAAIAQVVSGTVDTSGNILYLGATTDANGVPVPAPPQGGSGTAAALNMAVAKSGRSTGLTCSTVFATAMNVTVDYQKGCGTGTSFSKTFTNQVDVAGGSFIAEGDSGSLVVTQSGADPVALLFAGSDTDAVGNPVSAVLSYFQSGGNAAAFVGGGAHAVTGCTLPLKPAAATLTVPAAASDAAALQRAVEVRDAHAPELLAHPEVQAVGVGGSYDNPNEPAILFFVTRGQAHADLPDQVDGIRTRIIEGDLFAKRGALSAAESALLEKFAPAPQLVYSISDGEYSRAKAVHAMHVDELMGEPGVQGVGVGSSVDAPGEAALVIFLIRGALHNAVPPLIDGVRTRLRVSSRFHAGFGDGKPRRGCSAPVSQKKIRNLPRRTD